MIVTEQQPVWHEVASVFTTKIFGAFQVQKNLEDRFLKFGNPYEILHSAMNKLTREN